MRHMNLTSSLSSEARIEWSIRINSPPAPMWGDPGEVDPSEGDVRPPLAPDKIRIMRSSPKPSS